MERRGRSSRPAQQAQTTLPPPARPSVVVVESDNPTAVRVDRLPTLTPAQRSRSPVWRPESGGPTFSEMLRTRSSTTSLGASLTLPEVESHPKSESARQAPLRRSIEAARGGARPKRAMAPVAPNSRAAVSSQRGRDKVSSFGSPKVHKEAILRGFAVLETSDDDGEHAERVLADEFREPKYAKATLSSRPKRPTVPPPQTLSREFRDHMRRRRRLSEETAPSPSTAPASQSSETLSGGEAPLKRSSRRSGRRRRRHSRQSSESASAADEAFAAYLENMEKEDFEVPLTAPIPDDHPPSSSSPPSLLLSQVDACPRAPLGSSSSPTSSSWATQVRARGIFLTSKGDLSNASPRPFNIGFSDELTTIKKFDCQELKLSLNQNDEEQFTAHSYHE